MGWVGWAMDLRDESSLGCGRKARFSTLFLVRTLVFSMDDV